MTSLALMKDSILLLSIALVKIARIPLVILTRRMALFLVLKDGCHDSTYLEVFGMLEFLN